MICLCINKELVEDSSAENLQILALSVLKKQLVTEQQKTLILPLVISLKDLPQWNAETLEPGIQFFKNNIELHPENNISIEEMARKAFLSKYYFIKSFKQGVGLTPHQFQIQNRVRKAQRIIDKIPNLTEVALTTGFCDQSHFIKQFKRIVGLTPNCYRNARCHTEFNYP
jgi:AraC-like DNA-binding protein